MTTTPTSGAAIQRYKIGYHADEWVQRSSTPSVIPDASGSWVRYEDHIAALAAGQATAAQAVVPPNAITASIMRDDGGEAPAFCLMAAYRSEKDAMDAFALIAAAPAEPDPTPGDHPPPCDSELFESGVSVGLFDIPKWTAEALCKGIAAATGARVDWHYIGGRVHVKALPAPTSAEGAAYAALPTSSYAGRVYEEGFLVGTCPLYAADQMRSFADATYALRASHGQAPAPPPECETEAEKRAFAFGWFKALESERMKAESVQEDAARYRWLRERSSTMFVNVSINGDGAEIAEALDSAVDAARKQGEKQ